MIKVSQFNVHEQLFFIDFGKLRLWRITFIIGMSGLQQYLPFGIFNEMRIRPVLRNVCLAGKYLVHFWYLHPDWIYVRFTMDLLLVDWSQQTTLKIQIVEKLKERSPAFWLNFQHGQDYWSKKKSSRINFLVWSNSVWSCVNHNGQNMVFSYENTNVHVRNITSKRIICRRWNRIIQHSLLMKVVLMMKIAVVDNMYVSTWNTLNVEMNVRNVSSKTRVFIFSGGLK